MGFATPQETIANSCLHDLVRTVSADSCEVDYEALAHAKQQAMGDQSSGASEVDEDDDTVQGCVVDALVKGYVTVQGQQAPINPDHFPAGCMYCDDPEDPGFGLYYPMHRALYAQLYDTTVARVYLRQEQTVHDQVAAAATTLPAVLVSVVVGYVVPRIELRRYTLDELRRWFSMGVDTSNLLPMY